MTLWHHAFGAACVLAVVVTNPLLSQEEGSRTGPNWGLRLRSRSISTDRAATRNPAERTSAGRVHLIAQTDGSPLDREHLERLAARGVQVLGYIPDNGIALSAGVDQDLSGLGLRWIGTLEAADRRGFPNTAAASQDDIPGYYVVQFYSDVDMGDARSVVTGQQIEIRDNPSLLPTQLLIYGRHSQMMALSNHDIVVYIFPAADELITGIAVTPCVSGNTSYGTLLPFAASLSGGWSANDQGVANLTYSFGTLTAQIPADTVRALFQQAQQQWAALVKIAFTETTSRTGSRNIDLGFYAGSHGDSYPFDGPGGVLAHTFYPAPPNSEPIAGDMHLDADESWSSSGSGTDFYSVVLHELGHALGLGHSTNPADVMYPFYRHNTTFSANDINAIEAVYQSREATLPPPKPVPLALTIQPLASQVTAGVIALAGSTSGGQGTVRVTWTTDRGGLGLAQGTFNWNVSAVPLAVGRNTIIVRAQDDAASVVTQSVVIERIDTTPPPPPPPPSPQAPIIQITSPSDPALTITAMTAIVRGTASHPAGIRSISWRASTGASGVAQGTVAWDAGLVGLQVGVNSVIIDAVAVDGGMASKTVQITVVSPPPPGTGGGSSDTTPPSITIGSPSSTSVFTSAQTITITGTATDNVGVAVVRWETPVAGGLAIGTANWSTGPVALFVGMNNIVIRAYDAAGNASWRSLSVTRQ